MDSTMDSYQRFLSGDESSLRDIIREHKDGLILYINSLVRNVDTAEELTEETFVKLVLKRPRFSQKSSFKTWLYAVGRNVTLDYIRKNRLHLSLEECGDISADEEGLEKSWLRQEEKIHLHRTIEKLKPEYRQVLWLYYFENLSHKEISKIMGKSVHNIETLAYRARNSLKQKLIEEGFSNENI